MAKSRHALERTRPGGGGEGLTLSPTGLNIFGAEGAGKCFGTTEAHTWLTLLLVNKGHSATQSNTSVGKFVSTIREYHFMTVQFQRDMLFHVDRSFTP